VSETRLSSLNLWSAVMCGFSGTLFLGQLQSWKQVNAYNYFHCGQFFEKMIVACSVGSLSCIIPGSIHCHWCSGSRVCTVLKVFWCSHWYSNSLASTKLAKTLSTAYCLIHFLPTTCLFTLRLSTINTSCQAP